MKNKKELEYEEAPSGYVTLYNYKEPFMRYEKGFGFQGVLVFDGETDKVQCHLCGEWHVYLPNHLMKEHSMNASQYKEEVGLNQTTALIGEKLRAKLIANGIERFKNLRINRHHSKESREKIRQARIKYNTLEKANKMGTCPAQLIDRLLADYTRLGRMPREKEMGYYQTIVKVYGSIKNACQVAGIPYRKPGQTINHRKSQWTKDYCITSFRNFFIKNNRFPSFNELGNKSMWEMIRKYGKEEIKKQALTGDGKYRRVKGEAVRFSENI